MARNHHNDGQRDGSKRGSGNANQPHGHGREFSSFGKELKKVHKENGDYWKGHRNGQKNKGK